MIGSYTVKMVISKISNMEKAQVLVDALPYIKRLNGKTIVIKYGGSALTNPIVKDTIINNIALMKLVGMKPVVIHGGGPEINAMLNRLDVKSEFISGLRVTSKDAVEVVEMVLSGKVNKSIVTDIETKGVRAIGISGKDGSTIKARKLIKNSTDYGHVGEIDEIDTSLIRSLLNNDFIPVIAPIGKDNRGNTYNINADYVAMDISAALQAEKLLFLTDVPGVLMDINDPESVVHFMGLDEIDPLIENGTISGGMIPKIESCRSVVKRGVNNVHIIDGHVENCLLLEIFTPEGIGTMVQRHKKED